MTTKTYNEWLPLEEFHKHYMEANIYQNESKKTWSRLCRIVNDLHLMFPSPEAYLEAISNNPNHTFCHPYPSKEFYNELIYILAWIYLHRVASDPDADSLARRDILTKYLLHKMPRLSYRWVYHFELLTPEESDFFWKKRRSPGLILHLLLVAKPLRQFTDEDVKETSLYKDSRCGQYYNPKFVGEFLYRNGYTEKLYTNARTGKNFNLAQLSAHPSFGRIFEEYHQYLLIQDCPPQTVQTALRAIKYLVAFLEREGLEDCSKFDDFMIEKLIKFQKTNGLKKKELKDCSIKNNLYEIDLFFQWGGGRYSFFPEVYKSPVEIMSKLNRAANKAYWSSDGLAFNNEEDANQLARAIISYRPKDEMEKLCRYYWTICMSTVQRQSWFLQLEAGNCLAPMALDPTAIGLYSKYADKGGNVNGQFPVLHKMGIKAVKELEIRTKRLNLQPIPDPTNGKTYVHLFQLTDWPWILSATRVNAFLKNIKEIYDLRESDGELIKGSSHSFRTYLLGEVVVRTGRLDAAKHAAGHRNDEQIRAYLKSKLARRCLARAFVGKFEAGEITGQFFIRIMEMLTSEKTSSEEMYQVLTTEIPLNEYMKKYGVRAKCGCGTCMNQSGCPRGSCWGCPYFLMTKEDVEIAIRLLTLHLIDIQRLNNWVKDFSSSTLAKTQLKAVVLITKHLLKLGVAQEILDAEEIGRAHV
jgi:hypothetical protein